MSPSHISLKDVHLHYSSVAFKERSLKALLARSFNSRHAKTAVHDIHALKGVNVEIAGGERIALLGHNGAGKTTFLRAVAGLYPLSKGTLRVSGNVRALFDLSLGFEPDATGRENILYRGLMFGLTPQYMREREPEIVEFADIGEFIDYPIKTYSAGMLVRLAFAISTSIGGGVLLLDEVIGAGDINFMKKARQRMASLIDHAEILVLASHDLTALGGLCQRGLVFDHGAIAFDGPIKDALFEYKRMMDGSVS
jgi:lipopolysaccharide transport system ATP-binding protein